MKKKFRKGFEELKSRVASTGIDGEWTESSTVRQFRAVTGAILNYWESTGTVNFQGRRTAAKELEEKLFKATAKNKASGQESTAGDVDLSPLLEALVDIPISNWLDAGIDQDEERVREIARGCMLDLCELLGLAQAFSLQGKLTLCATEKLHELVAERKLQL